VNLPVLSPAPSGSSGHRYTPLQRNADDDNTDNPAVNGENAQPVPHQEANEKSDGNNAGHSSDAYSDSVKEPVKGRIGAMPKKLYNLHQGPAEDCGD